MSNPATLIAGARAVPGRGTTSRCRGPSRGGRWHGWPCSPWRRGLTGCRVAGGRGFAAGLDSLRLTTPSRSGSMSTSASGRTVYPGRARPPRWNTRPGMPRPRHHRDPQHVAGPQSGLRDAEPRPDRATWVGCSTPTTARWTRCTPHLTV
ncbi:hypothetical protein HBB16_00290 [Pseudonocardia sp. MCCB 268]|nr:hypothetical protein [Pseudonocardia cytotoxica]